MDHNRLEDPSRCAICNGTGRVPIVPANPTIRRSACPACARRRPDPVVTARTGLKHGEPENLLEELQVRQHDAEYGV